MGPHTGGTPAPGCCTRTHSQAANDHFLWWDGKRLEMFSVEADCRMGQTMPKNKLQPAAKQALWFSLTAHSLEQRVGAGGQPLVQVKGALRLDARLQAKAAGP